MCCRCYRPVDIRDEVIDCLFVTVHNAVRHFVQILAFSSYIAVVRMRSSDLVITLPSPLPRGRVFRAWLVLAPRCPQQMSGIRRHPRHLTFLHLLWPSILSTYFEPFNRRVPFLIAFRPICPQLKSLVPPSAGSLWVQPAG